MTMKVSRAEFVGLEPCPWCGNEPRVTAYPDFTYVGCVSIDCEVNPTTRLYDTFDEAVQAWNTRAERTCHVVMASRMYVLSDGTEVYEDGCSECNGFLYEDDNYCPSCGARVEVD